MKYIFHRLAGLVVALFVSLAGLNSLAQNLDETDPLGVQSATEIDRVEEPAPPTYGENSISPENADLVILDQLNSINLLTDTGEKGDAAAEAQAREIIDHLITPVLKSYIGKPLSIAGLLEIKTVVQSIFDQNSHAIVRVVLPEQEITSGEIILAVITARVGNVTTTESRALSHTRLKQGNVLSRQTMIDELDWLSRPSKKTASALLAPGSHPGQTDVNLVIESNPKPWTVFVSRDNHGVEVLGRDRWTFGAIHHDLFDKDVELLYQYVTDSDLNKLEAHFASVTVPIPALRHEMRWFGYVAESNATAGTGNNSIRIGGQSWQSSLEYRVPLARAFDRKLRHELVFGYDAKGANSDLEFGLLDPLRTNTEIHQFHFGYEGDWKDQLGRTSFDLALFMSPGGFNSANDDAAFLAARANSESDYTYADLNIDRLTHLPASLQVFTELSARLASTNLLPSEQLALSGTSAVRGFEPSRRRGDSGVVLRNELRSPAFSLLNKGDAWQPFTFLDVGRGNSANPLPDEEALALGSSGIGVRLDWNRMLTGEILYGWQILEDNFDDSEDGRFHAKMTLQW